MTLTKIWIETAADGLVRADQVVGIDAHQTPEVAGKTAHWLLDVVLDAPVGAGDRSRWDIRILHRTLAQTRRRPVEAPAALAALLAQLDAADVAGIVSASVERPKGATPGTERIEFRFTPFRLQESRYDELEGLTERRAVTTGPAAIESPPPTTASA